MSRPVWKAIGTASLAGLAVAGAYEAVVRAAGVSLAMGPSKAEAEPVPTGGFVGFTAMFVVAGLLLALAAAHCARRPGHTYARVAWSVVAISLALPFLPAHMAGETRVVLALAHVVVGAAVIPTVTRALKRHCR
ncbi:DUF6069 family protein [Streptomyces spectabilis]|uniref:Uncharacterized protein n=1 Tax=Streptomyces spectabilis TaxID=68270 RepID=A0A516R2W5_STRST|nr:DUF6069 family protein [Streptomyces spectabilis]QDQ09980.1 hypothetical protein FH965_04915 [Streptomyces spectabilis]